MALTKEQKIAFYKNRDEARSVILREIKKKKLILFGARSLNRQLPKFLNKQTDDYDVIAPKGDAEKVAKQIERKLDKKFKGNFYIVEKGKYGGTYKVKRVLGKEGVVDVVRVEEKVPYVKKKGIKLSTLAYEKKKIKQSLADKASAFRHDKDRERMGRIKISEGLKKKNVRKPKRRSNNLTGRDNIFAPTRF